MAVPLGKVSIQNGKHGEYVYANAPKYNESRRFALTWAGHDTPVSDVTMHWEIISFEGGNYYGIKSVKHNEWLYVGEPQYNECRRFALTWKGAGDPKTDPTMRFRIQAVDANKGTFGIQSLKHNQWIFANAPKYNKDRRHVLAWQGAETPFNDDTMKWFIESLEPKSVTVKCLTMHLEELAKIGGGSGGEQELTFEYETGSTFTQEQTATATTVSQEATRRLQSQTQSTSQGTAKASGSVNPSALSAEAEASYKTESSQKHNELEQSQLSSVALQLFKGALASTSVREKKTYKSKISYATPCYIYQAVVEVHMSDGTMQVFKGAIQQSSEPLNVNPIKC